MVMAPSALVMVVGAGGERGNVPDTSRSVTDQELSSGGAEPLYLSQLARFKLTLPPDWTVTLWASPAQRTRSLAIAPIPT